MELFLSGGIEDIQFDQVSSPDCPHIFGKEVHSNGCMNIHWDLSTDELVENVSLAYGLVSDHHYLEGCLLQDLLLVHLDLQNL